MKRLTRAGRLVTACAATTTLALSLTPVAATAHGSTPGTQLSTAQKISRTITLPDGSEAENVEGRWFVEFDSPSISEGASEAAVESNQEDFADAVTDESINATVTSTYGELWNGVAIEAEDSDLEAIAELEGVASIKPVVVIPAPQIFTGKDGLTTSERSEGLAHPAMLHANELGGAKVAQNLGYTGKDVTIGIIDSGVDYDHLDLGGTGVDQGEDKDPSDGDGSTAFPNKKVISGWDFVGDEFESAASDTPHPDKYPDDCGGHGTHVAGIAAANGQGRPDSINGVAPDATIRAYRVFGCESNTNAELIAAAMDKAAQEGVDVLNMSIGTDYMVFADYPIAISAAQLSAKGIVVVVAQGNIGDRGRWTMGGAGAHPDVITVGSVDNSIETNYYMQASTLPDRKMSYQRGEGSAFYIGRSDSDSVEDNFQVMEAGTVAAATEELSDRDPALLCSAPDQPELFKDKAVIIRRGGPEKGCNFYTKVRNAENAGARLVIIDNNKAKGALSVTVASPNGKDIVQIPVVSISRADGDALREAVRKDPATTVKFPTPHITFDVPTAGNVSDFSSWGLNSQLDLKPDVVAPGGLIWSTWPLSQNTYQTISGTSMASPYVAGTAALILQAHPEIKNAQGLERTEEIRWRLRSTAKPRNYSVDATYLEPLARQGAGLVDAAAAIDAPARFSPSVLNLGQAGDAGTKDDKLTHKVTLRNTGKETVTYRLSHVDAATITGESAKPTRSTTAGVSAVSTDGMQVTLQPGNSTELTVTVTPPMGMADADFYSGYVLATPVNDSSKPVRLPFSGIGGKMTDAKLLAKGVEIVNEKLITVDPDRYTFGYNDFHNFGMYSDPVRFIYTPDIPLTSVVMDLRSARRDGHPWRAPGHVA